MRRWFGLLLLLAGLIIGLSSFFEWHSGKTAAQDLTHEEIADFEEIQQEVATEAKVTPAQPKAVPPPLLTSGIERKLGEKTATLLIPEIEQKYSVYWGADDATLKKGVGMFVSDLTTVPGGYGHTVLSGHRDTVFTRLAELEEKDNLMVEYEGRIYVYEIFKMWVTDEDDRSVIVEKDESILTLTTCYPFDFIGSAPDRYIVQARLVSTQPAK
ncbi:class D sortase [Planomicrobium sp. CPCC 101110]|uniref:class D sortase n=1 Tax=Planomicrobium sp. CPCC 101110 TaxID=2599619 RepID=UPI0011B7AE07|nr:class D sortase [Planomicrobium sp. CPCC 101110]TWT25097.1 class D sortase [Planomicrobium sp. CPCC 101110]